MDTGECKAGFEVVEITRSILSGKGCAYEQDGYCHPAQYKS
jgi:hypothetical protein